MGQAGMVIRDFLRSRRVAVVGVSRQPRDYSRIVCQELEARGIEVVAVNRAGGELGGRPFLSSLAESPEVGGALLLLPLDELPGAIREAVSAGVPLLWCRRPVAEGTPAAVALAEARAAGIRTVAGMCPLMFLPDAAFPHRLHGGVLKLLGRFPS